MDPRGAALLEPLPADLDGGAYRQARAELLQPKIIGTRRGVPVYAVKGGARQYWVAPLPPFHVADGATLTAAALAELSPTPPVVVPGGLLEIGSRLEFSAFGRITTAATPGTWTFGIYIGTIAIAVGQAAIVSAALAAKASMTNVTWRIEGNASVRAVGTGTAGQLLGALEISNITTNGTDLAPATAPTAFGFDTTVSNFVRLGVTPSVATGSIVCHYFGCRLVN